MTLYAVRSRQAISLVRSFELAGKPLAESIPRKRKPTRYSSAESLEQTVFIPSSRPSANLGDWQMMTENRRTRGIHHAKNLNR